jgi:hypothetical protein
MQKIVFIIIFQILLGQFGFAQKQVITKMIIPLKQNISLIKTGTIPPLYHPIPKTNYAEEPAINSLLLFNDQPVLKLNKPVTKRVSFFTELSFSDVLESSMNTLKPDLIYTYDDQVTELFKDAPSLFKVKCIIAL